MGIAANKNFPHGTYYLEVNLEFKQYLDKETTIKDSIEYLVFYCYFTWIA